MNSIATSASSSVEQSKILKFFSKALPVGFFIILSIFLFNLNTQKVEAAACNVTATGTWTAAATGTATFSGCTGTSGFPAAADTLTVNSGVVFTISWNATVAALTVAAPTVANGVVLTAGVSVTVTGALTLTANTSAVAETVTLNGANTLLTVGSVSIGATSGTGANTITGLTATVCSGTGGLVSNGTISVTGNSTSTGVASITMGACKVTSTGLLTITGGTNTTGKASVTTSTGALTASAGVTFAGTAANALLTVGTTGGVFNLTGALGAGGTVSLVSGTTTNFTGTSSINGTSYTIAGNVEVDSGTLTLAGATLTTITGTTLVRDGATMVLGNYAFTQTGTLTVGNGTSGVFNGGSGSTGTYTFSSGITTLAGSVFNLAANSGTHAVSFAGTAGHNASGTTFNTGTGTQTVTGTGAFAFAGSGNMTYGNTFTIPTNRAMTSSKSGGTLTFAALTMASPTAANSLTLNNGTNTTVTGALTLTASASTLARTITLGSAAGGAANLNVGSISMPASTSSGASKITCFASATQTGTLTVTGSGTIAITGNSTSTGLSSIDMSPGGCNIVTGTVAGTAVTLTGGSNATGGPALLKMGTGTLTMNGNLAFGGANAGKSQFNMSANGGTLVLNGATLPAVGTSGAYTISASTHLTSTGTSAINYATAVNTWGNLNLNGGTLSFAAAENFTSMSLANGVTLAPGANLVTNTGDLTCGSGGSATISGSGGLTLSGASAALGGGTCNVTNNGTFTVSGGTAPTVSGGATYVFSGPLSVSTLLTNSGIVTASNDLSGAGNFVNAAGSTLNIGFATTPAITTLTATGTTPDNLVNYTAASPSCEITAYDDLTFSGSGTVTCDITSVSDQLTLSTATSLGFTTGANLVVGGLTTIGSGATLTQGATFDFTTGGLTTTGTGTFTNTGIGDFTLGGDVNNAGTIILNSGNLSSCTEGANSILVRSTVSNTLRSWSGAGTFTLRNLDVDDMTGSITAGTSVFSGDTTWTAQACGATYSGTLYTDEGSTLMTSGPTVSIKVNGAGTYSAVANGSGVYSIPGITVSAGQVVSIYLDTNGGAQANLITKAVGAGNVTGLDMYQNRVIIRNEDGTGATTGLNLDQYDNTQDSDMLFAADTSGNSVFEAGTKVIVWGGTTFTPGGFIITAASSDGTNTNIEGDMKIQTSATLNMSGQNLYIGGDFLNQGSFNVSLLTFQATATGHEVELGGSIPDGVIFNGSGGGWTFQSAVHIGSNLTMTAGTLSGTNDITLDGGGYVNGDGVINLTGGTFTALGGGGNFAGNSNWTFNNLTFSNGVRSDIFSAVGTGSVTVTGVMTVSANSTLNAGAKVWTLSGTGIPFVKNGTFNPETSTVQYTGTTATNITASTYNNLSLIPAATVTYTLGTASSQTFTINGDFVAGNGTNALTVGQSTYAPVINALGNFTLAGNLADWLDGGTAQINLKPVGTKTFGFLSPVSPGLSVGTVTIGSGSSTPKIVLNGYVSFDHLTVAAAHELDLSSYDMTVAGVGTGASRPFVMNGTFTPSTGQVIYASAAAASTIDIQPTTYYNLSITPSITAGHTYTLASASPASIVVQNNLLIGDGTRAVTVNATTNDPSLDINGSMTIAANATFVASDTSVFTIANNFTNSGTFTHSSGTVTFDTTATATISGATTFNNFTSTTPNKTLQFGRDLGNGPVFTVAGTMTITGTAGNLINIYSDLSGTKWNAHFNSVQSSMTYVNVRDGGCDTGTANVNLSNSNSVSNNSACWVFSAVTTTVGNGTDPSPSTIAPGASATEIDRFSLVTSTGTDTVTGMTVTLTGDANAYTNIGTVGVYTTAGGLKCSATPSSNTVALTTCAIAVTTTPTEYKVLITPLAHAAMPAVPGAEYATKATVTSVTATNTIAGADSNSATITVDNLSPDGVSASMDFGTSGAVNESGVDGSPRGIAKDSTYMYLVGDTSNPDFRIEKRLLSTGAFDNGFGTSGVVTSGVGDAYAIAIDSTYMYVAGTDSTSHFHIEKRLLSTGALCTAGNCGTAFDTDGIVVGDATSRYVYAIAIDSTYMYVGGPDSSFHWRVEKRLLSTGALDSGFGTSGVATGDSGSQYVQAIAVDSTYMYVTGLDSTGDWRIEKRLLSTGALCTAANCGTAFDTDGIVMSDATSEGAYAIAIDSTYMYVAGFNNGDDYRIEKRLLSTGALDSGFGTSGIATGAAASYRAKAIAIDPSYTYMIVGGSTAGGNWYTEKRLLSTGALDTGFGTSGAITGSASSTNGSGVAIDSKYVYTIGGGLAWRIEKYLLTTGVAPAVEVTPATYRYVKFAPTVTRTEPTSGCTQFSEFTLTSGGANVAWPGGSTATSSGGWGVGEDPSKAIDGNVNTKLCETSGSPVSFVVDTTSTVTFDGYKYATANDSSDRDPITWTVEGSNNGSSWTVLDTRIGESPTTTRLTYTRNYALTPTAATATPGNASVALVWANPKNPDFLAGGTVVVLRQTTSDVANFPVEGTTYTVGNTIGTATVACVVTGTPPATSCTDSGLSNGTPYYYKIFTQDSRGNYNEGAIPVGSPATPILISITVGDGTNGAPSTIAPGASATEIDRFSLVTSSGTDTVTGMTVTLTGDVNAYTNIGTVGVYTTGGTLKCSATPSSNTVALTSCAISATTSSTEYVVKITPKSHAAMAAVPGAEYATKATVISITSTDIPVIADSNSATITVDNLSPDAVSSSVDFGTSGVVAGDTASQSANAMAKDSTYMYVIGGDTNTDWRIEKRLLSTGAVDSGFGTSGVVTGAAASASAWGVSIDSTYMYVVGTDTNTDWRIEKRLLSTGAVDSGFGTSGVVTGAAASSIANAIAIDSAYMYVVGSSSGSDWRIEKRLLSTGAVDSGFGTSGVVTSASASWNPFKIYIDSTYMYVVGYDSNINFRIEKRLLSTGALDSNFGTSGVVSVGATTSGAFDIAIDSTYMYVVGQSSNLRFYIEKRLLSTGAVDSGFGTSGTITGAATSNTVKSIAIDSTYMYISGSSSGNDMRIEKRLLSTGAVDSGFGTSGVVTGAAASSIANAIAIDSTYMYVAGSTDTPDFFMQKLLLSTGAAPAVDTASTVTAGAELVNVAWTNPKNPDVLTAGTILVLRNTSAVSDVPVEGTTYTVGNTIGTSTVACVVTGTPPATTCSDTGLTGAVAYHYKIFTQDSRGNYNAGTVPSGSPATPTAGGSRTISGTVYSEEFNSATSLWPGCGASTNISMSINGGAKSSVVCTTTTGAFAFTNKTLAANDIITIYMDTNGGDKAVTYTRAIDENTDITGLALIRNTAVLRYEGGSSITNTNIGVYDKTNDSDIPLDVTGGNLVGDAGVEVHIDPSMNYAPGGTVSINDMHVKGIFTGAGQNVTINDGLFIDASGVFNAPTTLFLTGNLINDGTFNANGGTVNMNLGSSYQFSKPITIDHSMVVGGTQTNFPVMISGTFDGTSGKPNLKHTSSGGPVMNANGYDIAFFSDSNLKMKLRHEVEQYDGSSGDAVFWVRIPSLSSAVNTTIYMAYRNPSVTTDQSDPKNVWSNGYAGVWHMKYNTAFDSFSAGDSTKNSRNGIDLGGVGAVAGKIGYAASLNGTTQWIDTEVPMATYLNNAFEGTFEGWAYLTADPTGSQDAVNGAMIINDANEGDGVYGYIGMGASVEGNWYGAVNNGARSISQFTKNVWSHVAYTFTFDGGSYGTGNLYVNGSPAGTPHNFSSVQLAGKVAFGESWNGYKFTGKLDEIRISNTPRSANWIATEYNNQNSPSTFYSFGTDSVSGSSTVIAGANNITFNNFVVSSSNGGGKFLKFKSAGAYTFNGAFNAVGQPGNILSISSTNPTSPWVATFNGTSSVNYASIRDSSCSGGNAATGSFTNVNLGGNGNCFVFKSLRADTTSAGGENGNAAGGPATGGGTGGNAGGNAGGETYSTQSWIFCANEDATCTFTGTRQVRYWAGSGASSYLVATGSILCSNGNFGDPNVGQAKFCYYSSGFAGGGAGGGGGDSGFLYDGTNYAAAGGAGVDANISPIKYVLGLLGLVILVVLIRIFI